MMWDFWSKAPESLHQVTMLFSDRGTPDGYRHMDGFGSHTFSLINAKNERHWVKFHFKSRQGIKNLSDAEAEALRVLKGRGIAPEPVDFFRTECGSPVLVYAYWPGMPWREDVVPVADLLRDERFPLIRP